MLIPEDIANNLISFLSKKGRGSINHKTQGSGCYRLWETTVSGGPGAKPRYKVCCHQTRFSSYKYIKMRLQAPPPSPTANAFWCIQSPGNVSGD